MPPRAKKNPRILYSGTHDPSVIPPPQLSSEQITTIPRADHILLEGPNLDRTARPWISVPAGEYDLAGELRTQGTNLRFDLLVVQTDGGMANIPKNLGQFDCPKILLLGDTHHLERPIQNVIEYARSEDFDGIVSVYDRQHLHWFHEAGFCNLAWIPGLGVEHIPTKRPSRPDPQVCFVGAVGTTTHIYRTKLLEGLANEGAPLIWRPEDYWISRAFAADMYCRSAITFNCSLNGDLNLRVFEVLSAGGFLLTDDLATESGLGHAFKIGTDLVTYSDAADLLEKVPYYLDRPAEAAEIAAEGHRTYVSSHLPEMKVRALLEWVFAGQLDPKYDPSDDFRFRKPRQSLASVLERAAMYETIQEEHRQADSIRLLMVGQPALRYADDLSDLPRLQLYWTSRDPNETSTDGADFSRDHIEELPFEVSRRQSWDVILWSGTKWQRYMKLKWGGQTHMVESA